MERRGLLDFDPSTVSVPGICGDLSQVHSVHQADANYRPLHNCPQGVKCAPNPFPARPITQWTYSSKDWQRNREIGWKDASNPTVLRPLLQLDHGAQWQRRNSELTHLCSCGFYTSTMQGLSQIWYHQFSPKQSYFVFVNSLLPFLEEKDSMNNIFTTHTPST